jgi:D-arabinose 1-dehydrogenase-like Zn-dependent alcohol dehydrogenase
MVRASGSHFGFGIRSQSIAGGHCHICKRCRAGDFGTCEKENINGPFNRYGHDAKAYLCTGIFSDGGYAEYATLRSEAVAALPSDVDPAEAAPLLCAGVTTFSQYLQCATAEVAD